MTKVSALVVMPHPRVLALLRTLEGSAEVSCVATRRELQRALRELPEPEVVLTDVVLPDGDWRGVIEDVGSRAEVIVCSARAPGRSFYCDVIQNGAYDLLSTPYEPANMRNLLAAAAARRRMRRMSAALARRKSA